MGTRSIIAIPEGKTGFRGRYCHWDGYPSGVGHALRSIVLRDGMEKAIQTLIIDHYGWSSINARAVQDELTPGMDDGRFVNVPGYGVAYTESNGVDKDSWITREDAHSWCEYAYVLHNDHIAVYVPRGSKWVKRAYHTIRFPELSLSDLHALDTEDILALA